MTGPELAAAVASRVPAPVTRFAPAPTGFLHLGHVVNAVYVWGLARALRGRVILRIEDHDRQRSRRELEAALLDDLDWLGFDADRYPTSAYRHRRCDGRQSDRDAVYREALAPLVARGLVYGCRCSRADIERSSGRHQRHGATGSAAGVELRYPGTCRDRGILPADEVAWRLRIGPDTEAFDDVRLGAQVQTPAHQCGDLLLRDRLGNWTYQCVATVDDFVQDVTLVVRGTDLLASTGRQILFARMLGRPAPAAFLHHPLIMKSVEQKLSKSDGDTGIRDLRARGWSAADVIGEAAALGGLTGERRPLGPDDIAKLFVEPRP